MTRKAFTLIELLVVITILLMLMGMLVPAVVHVRKTAVRKLAATRLKGLALAIERHFLQRGNYPPGTGFPDDADWSSYDPDNGVFGKYSLYHHLCGPLGNGLTVGGRTYGPYLELDESQYEDDGTGRFILGPWGNPWVYLEHRTEFMRVVHDVDYRAHKAKRYDIICMGPDGVMSAANLLFYLDIDSMNEENDITNWD